MTEQTAPAPAAPALKQGAIGFVSNVVIAVASVAPGYSLAATLGFIAATGIGLQSPSVIVLAFIPMLCIAASYYYLNRADPDCGTTFSWMTKAMGPQLGWMGGWAIVVADVLVMPSLASVAANYTFQLFGQDNASNLAITLVGIAWIAIMTLICVIGIELNARTQQLLLGMEFFTLTLFAVVAIVKIYANHPPHSVEPSLSWFNPFEASSGTAVVDAMLLAVFIYWGWDSAVTVNEESENSSEGPGRAAVVSTFVLLGIYVLVAVAAQGYGGVKSLVDNQADVFAPLGHSVLGGGLDKLLIIAVLTSASASTQTTILPTARTTLSMARQKAIPTIFGQISPRFLTPTVSTIAMGAVSALVYGALSATSPDNLIADAFTSLSMTIAFYYGFTGLACVVFYRRHLFESARNFLFIGVLPLVGAGILGAMFVKAVVDYSKVDGGYAKPLLGIGSPVVISLIAIVVGLVLMVAQWAARPAFFRQRPFVVDPEVAAGRKQGVAVTPE